MKIRSLVAAVVFAGAMAASSAQACVILNDCNFSGGSVSMGNLQVGQAGTITDSYLQLFSAGNSTIGYGIANGNLPTNAEVIFNYNFTGLQTNPSNALSSAISYGPYTTGGHTYHGFSNANSIFGISQQGFKDNVAGVSQVFATANLNGTTGSTSIANFTHTGGFSLQQFTTSLFAYFNTIPPGTATITYRVVSLPLPASLPMMLLAIGGMFGLARASKRKVLAA